MPPSRYVSADRLMRMLVYVSGAVLVLVAGDFGLRAAGTGPGARRAFVLGWLIAFPLVGWRVWRAPGARPRH